jgi:hypothetical protein
MIQPIPPCPQWFVEFMTGFRDGVIAEALAIEAEESGAAVKSSVDAADAIRRLSRERPDILKRTTRTSARLWLGALASDPCAGSSAPAVAWEQPEKTKPRRTREPSLARLVAKAKQMGVDVTIEADGTATFRTGSSTTTVADENPQTELDDWIAKHAH